MTELTANEREDVHRLRLMTAARFNRCKEAYLAHDCNYDWALDALRKAITAELASRGITARWGKSWQS